MKQQEVMKLLNISRTTLWRYVDSGIIKTYGERHHRVYDRDSVMNVYNQKLISEGIKYKSNSFTFKNENLIHIKIDLYDGVEQGNLLNTFFKSNNFINTVTLDITNEFSYKEFNKLYDSLTKFSKTKLKKIFAIYTESDNDDILSVITLLQEKLLKNNCKLVILKKANFKDNIEGYNAYELLEKSKIKIFNTL